MPRPCCRRKIAAEPFNPVFQPQGGPDDPAAEIVLALDEFEVLRLVDLLGQYQEEAARNMAVSRPTIGRILERAHQKVAEALVYGKTLRIAGGCVEIRPGEHPRCPRCRRGVEGTGGPERDCPFCRQAPPVLPDQEKTEEEYP